MKNVNLEEENLNLSVTDLKKNSQSIIKTSDIFTQYLDQEECYRSNLSAMCLFMFLLCYRKLL